MPKFEELGVDLSLLVLKDLSRGLCSLDNSLLV